MAASKADSRARLIQAAVALSYRRGFRTTSLADIAKEAGVPLGNVYYYFKTKGEIGHAIIEVRLAQFETARRSWDLFRSPKERLCASVDAVRDTKQDRAAHGCPIGTLSTDLRREGGLLADRASVLFSRYMAWLEAQFMDMGKKKTEARGLALHLLSVLEGISLLANSFRDPALVDAETARLKKWVRGL
ncbi:MAG TPA: TetR/AcrR family transcriptional regulator [Thermoplasmata archaeon]|nr:TetR/AcrR family transcriptional regulator [Thermoplasmata archaeon]